ncbi:MAG: hypothetical protein ACR2QK_11135 [Acidimicrobiales bacterium]
MHADLQRLLAADLLTDFASKSMDRLRSLRIQLNEAEADVSFIRRVTQGRLDIVGHEVERRSGGAESVDPVAAEADTRSSLLFEMPEILTDAAGGSGQGPRSAGAVGRAVTVVEPGQIALSMVEQLDGIASPSQLSGIQAVHEADLADLFDALREFELELSSIRRQLHDRIDTIQDEIARRYRDGEASVDALLQ